MSKRFIDIGANLLDEMFQGNYNGSNKHLPDLSSVLKRSWDNGLTHIIVTAGNLKESKEALEFVQTDNRLYSTIGVHPTRTNEFEKKGNDDDYLNELINIAKKGVKCGKIVAIGECGLDYDRLRFSNKETQLKHFNKHFKLVQETGMLPMFIHNRNSSNDLYQILNKNKDKWRKAVIHSFSDNVQDLKLLLSLNNNKNNEIYIGINGCSLKTEENLNVVREIPINRLMIETDCPWCGIKKSHASYKYIKTNFEQVTNKKNHSMKKCVKGRSEPAHIIQVLEVISSIKNIDINQLSNTIYKNTINVFFSNYNNHDDNDDINEWKHWLIKQQEL